MEHIAQKLLEATLHLIASLPLSVSRWIGSLVGRASYLMGTRAARVTRENLALCFPSLSEKEMVALHRAIPHVLCTGLRNMGTTLGGGAGNFYSVAGHRGRNADELNVFRRDGQACPRCGSAIQRLLVGQRGSHICPECQKKPL